MSWSISITVSADGTIAATATDCAGGCSYYVASKHGGDWNEKSSAEVARTIEQTLKVRENHGWNALRGHVVKACQELALCLPEASAFDDDGRPVEDGAA